MYFGYEDDARTFGLVETVSGMGFWRDVTTFYTYPDTTPCKRYDWQKKLR